MKHRSLRLATFTVAFLALLVPVGGQARRVLGTVAVEAPVMLLPEPGRTPLATLSEGTQVQVLDAPEEGWYRISFQDNYLFGDRVGYVRAEHVRVNGRVPAAPSTRPLTPGAGHKAPKTTPAEEAGRSPLNGNAPHANGAPAAEPGASKTEAPASRSTLSESSIATAIIMGRRQKPGSDGLRLLETAENGTSGSGTGTLARSRVRLQIHTPLAWIQQMANDAAKASRSFGLEDVTPEMTEPVLRVVAYSAAPAAASDTRSGTWVRHIVLRSETKGLVVQPLSKEAFSEHVMSATRGTTVSEGLRATFPMDAVRRLRGPAGDAEFIITITGASGDKKDIRIARTHLAALPM